MNVTVSELLVETAARVVFKIILACFCFLSLLA